MRKNKWESNRDTLIKESQMPGSLTSYHFQLEVPTLPRQKKKKKQFLVQLWFFDDKYINGNNSTCIGLCLQNFSIMTKLSVFVWMVFFLKVEKERLNERRKEREYWGRETGAGGRKDKEKRKRGKGERTTAREREREREGCSFSLIVVSGSSHFQSLFVENSSFPDWTEISNQTWHISVCLVTKTWKEFFLESDCYLLLAWDGFEP